VFFQESLATLSFEPRPKRGIDPFPGNRPEPIQDWPTTLSHRQQTILPDN